MEDNNVNREEKMNSNRDAVFKMLKVAEENGVSTFVKIIIFQMRKI
jgi:hypothetical protein